MPADPAREQARIRPFTETRKRFATPEPPYLTRARKTTSRLQQNIHEIFEPNIYLEANTLGTGGNHQCDG